MYAAFKLCSLLEPYIDACWIASVEGPDPVQQRILPDACADIIFNISAPSLHTNGGIVPPYTAFTVGTMTRAHLSTHNPGARLLGIRFKPGGMAAFVRHPMHLLTDKHIPTPELSLSFLQPLQEALLRAANIREMLQQVQSFLLKHLPVNDQRQDRILAAVDVIKRQQGLSNPTLLATHVNMSLRNFERRFAEQVGTTPKTFMRIIRWMAAKETLKQSPASPLLSVALAHGYHDHAHFTKEFTAISGITPQAYLQK